MAIRPNLPRITERIQWFYLVLTTYPPNWVILRMATYPVGNGVE